jgi:hypothetical protein
MENDLAAEVKRKKVMFEPGDSCHSIPRNDDGATLTLFDGNVDGDSSGGLSNLGPLG